MKKYINKIVSVICISILLCMYCTACSSNEKSADPEVNSNQIQNEDENTNQSDAEDENTNQPDAEAENANQSDAEDENTNQSDTEDENTNQSDTKADSSKGQGNDNSVYDEADLNGSVVELLDNGFTLSPVIETTDKDGGTESVGAAPGCEDENDLVTITYSENTTFEIVTTDIASLTEVSRETTEKQSVKKQSSVLIVGSCQDTYHWTADKVIITRWKK